MNSQPAHLVVLPSVETEIIVPTDSNPLPPALADSIETVLAGVLSTNSRRAYLSDIKHFLSYLADRDLAFTEITRPTMVGYRAELARGYAPSTVNRRLTVARRLVTEAWELGILSTQSRNPAEGRGVSGLKNSGERGKPALTIEQARSLLRQTAEAGDLPALRDVALLHLLIGTGLRRSEIAAARLGDLRIEQGYNVLSVTGKGNKRRAAKLNPALYRDIINWICEAQRGYVVRDLLTISSYDLPLFSPVRKQGRDDAARWKAMERPLSDWSIWEIVTKRIKQSGLNVDTTPHGLRATFITLALEAGATISKVQDAAGHADPRTTDRYRRRRANLQDNAADYIQLND